MSHPTHTDEAELLCEHKLCLYLSSLILRTRQAKCRGQWGVVVMTHYSLFRPSFYLFVVVVWSLDTSWDFSLAYRIIQCLFRSCRWRQSPVCFLFFPLIAWCVTSLSPCVVHRLVFSMCVPFSSPVKSTSGQGAVFIFSTIYVPQQEAPPAEKYHFLLLLESRLNVLQNTFTPHEDKSVCVCGCFWLRGETCCAYCASRQQWDKCVFDSVCVTKTIDLKAVSSAFH